jgi:hypothetical protein
MQTLIPTQNAQANSKNMNNKDKEIDSNKNRGSNNTPIILVAFSALAAFGLVKIIQHKRRQNLMKDREMVHASPSYASRHLDELNYMDENEII